MYRLIIKAPFDPAGIEARLPGSTVIRHRTSGPWLVATVAGASRDQLIRWFTEFGRLREGEGFEAGTLLFYAEEEN